jgi:hypothetical protein
MRTASLSHTKREWRSRHREAHCPTCQQSRVFRKPRLHWAHETATIFTFGLWGIVWAAAALRRWREPWRCSFCGHHLADIVSAPDD